MLVEVNLESLEQMDCHSRVFSVSFLSSFKTLTLASEDLLAAPIDPCFLEQKKIGELLMEMKRLQTSIEESKDSPKRKGNFKTLISKESLEES